MRRNLKLLSILAVQTVILLGFLYALRARAFPLGVAGEWEWIRISQPPEENRIFLAVVGTAVYVGLAGIVMRWLAKRATCRCEGVAVCLLIPAAILVQLMAQVGAPVGYGLEKWVVAVSQRGSSGYFNVAKTEVHDVRKFLRDYPKWIQKQDALHLGTHPPGLILFEWLLLNSMEANPGIARFVVDSAPESVGAMLKVFGENNPMSLADRATFVLTGALTLLVCSATVVPLYGLSRRNLAPEFAFATAALWPLVSSALLFQPTADTAFPFVSTTIFAIAIVSTGGGVKRSIASGIACGFLFGMAMEFTLAFLAVGLVVAITTFAERSQSLPRKAVFLLTTLLGFLVATFVFWALTGANPFLTWWWNQKNHARFYEEFPRTYHAWIIANPIELAVGLGLPSVVWGFVGLIKPRSIPRVSLAALAVLAFLTLGGRNLSEVGRLWLPFMPALLLGSGHGMESVNAGPKTLVMTLALLALQVFGLETMIQVVYPI